MPGRKAYEICFCLLCIQKTGYKPDGSPVGDRILCSQLAVHLAKCELVKQEQVAEEASLENLQSVVGSAFFISTFKNEAIPTFPKPPDESGEVILGLNVHHDPRWSENLNSPSLPEDEDSGDGEFFHMAELGEALPAVPCPIPDYSSSTRESKRERNRATVKAHLTFNHIDRLLTQAFGMTSPTNSDLNFLENVLSQAHYLFESITRHMPSLDERRTNLTKKFNHLESQLRLFRGLQPKEIDIPRVYDTGKCDSDEL